jgi:8-hydroxy-5-deazaflavin:NADPH oxidoreductase
VKIGILGTGMVGRALAGKLAGLRHNVVLGTRDPQQTMGRTASDRMGHPPVAVWLKEHSMARLATFADAARHGELVVNATSGGAALDALTAAGEANLNGKVLLDVANPLDFSQGVPPALTVCNTDSLGEEIQRAFPKARVVKSLNTVNALVMVDPDGVGGGDHSMFVCGNDAEAKATVVTLVRSLGWRDVIDLGDITSARGAEMYLPIWLRLMGALRTPKFNIKVVR